MKNFSIFLSLVIISAFLGCANQTKQTIENIKLGIKTETTASKKYEAYSKQAYIEGLDTIARLFEAASKAEAIHASNHASVLKTFKVEMDEFTPEFEVMTTLENLEEAIKGETDEVENLYPMFIEDAKTKKLKTTVVESLTYALETEKDHIELFTIALNSLKAGKQSGITSSYSICPVCGDTYDSQKAPDNCDLCSADKDLFIQIK